VLFPGGTVDFEPQVFCIQLIVRGGNYPTCYRHGAKPTESGMFPSVIGENDSNQKVVVVVVA